MSASLDLSALNTTLGAYCRENSDVILSTALVPNSAKEHLQFLAGIKDQQPLPSINVADIVKPFSTTFSATSNGIAAAARILQVRAAKVDLQIYPQEFFSTWLGKYASAPASSPYEVPFEQFLMESIAAKVQENVEQEAIFRGSYNAGGSTPGAICDGFLEIISDEVTALNLTETVTGVVTSANAVDSIETVFDAVGDAYSEKELKCFVNPTIKKWYDRDYRATYGANPYNTEFKKTFIDGTKCEIVAMPALGTSQRIIIAPQETMYYGADLESNQESIVVEREKRALNIMMDFKVGVQIGDLNAIWINDQA